MRLFGTSRSRRMLFVAAAVVLAASAGAIAVVNADKNAGGAETTVGAQPWADEFDGPAGKTPDPNKWNFDIGGTGWGNKERQYYTDSTSNAALDGQGHLVITAREEDPADSNCWYGSCQYTSAKLVTKDRFSQAYGRFEARIKLPLGEGLLPAFWLLGNDVDTNPWPYSGEIDIMENVGFEPNTVYGNLHGPGYSGAHGIGGGYTWSGAGQLADDFHTFTLDWAPDSITWYVDGHQYARKTSIDLNGNRWVFDHPFYMILNLAVGGVWPGDPPDATAFPQQMVVDYVRVNAHT